MKYYVLLLNILWSSRNKLITLVIIVYYPWIGIYILFQDYIHEKYLIVLLLVAPVQVPQYPTSCKHVFWFCNFPPLSILNIPYDNTAALCSSKCIHSDSPHVKAITVSLIYYLNCKVSQCCLCSCSSSLFALQVIHAKLNASITPSHISAPLSNSHQFWSICCHINNTCRGAVTQMALQRVSLLYSRCCTQTPTLNA